jgi:DNA-directed RNA polymerase specialized sigma24 family protein
LAALPSSDPTRSLRSVLLQCVVARLRESMPLELSAQEERAVDGARFLPGEHRWGGGWAAPPQRFPSDDPTRAAEMRDVLRAAIAELPLSLRLVIVLRDVEGFDADEVSAILSLSPRDQRKLLHLARSRARAAVEHHFHPGGTEQRVPPQSQRSSGGSA